MRSGSRLMHHSVKNGSNSRFTAIRAAGIRDYRPGDPRRDVHWKASARGSGLRVRIAEPTAAAAMMVVVNTATNEGSTAWIDPERQEAIIVIAASIVHEMFAKGWAVGGTATSSMPGVARPIRVPAGKGPKAEPATLAALAAIGRFVRTDFASLLAAEGRTAGWGTRIVAVSSIVDEPLAAELVRLRRAGRPVSLITLDSGDEVNIPGVATFQVPLARAVPSGFARPD